MTLMEKEIYEFGPFILDPVERTLCLGKTPVTLTPKAFETLVFLLRNPGRLISKDELLKHIWPDSFVEEVNLAVSISAIRKALGENPRDSRYIATVPGRGYRFIASVRNLAQQNGNGSELGQVQQNQRSAAETQNPSESTQEQSLLGAIARLTRHWIALALAISFALMSSVAVLLGKHLWRAGQKAEMAKTGSASVAVLPFADLSAAKDQEYFSDGLTEELINDLAQLPGLKVVARASVFQFKEKSEDLRRVGRELGVSNILEGSVRKQGAHVRISAELVRAEDGFQIWSESFDRKSDDIISIQEEIARSAAAALQLKLLGVAGGMDKPSERSSNAQAYEAYLRARYFTTRGRDKADLDEATTYIERAIKLDDKYAAAWALRSYIVDVMGDVGQMEPETAFRRAREDAERAIELDSNAASGYLALAWVQINRDWDWKGADLSLKKAAELEPGSASILRNRSFLCHALGQLPEAIQLHEQALALDPLLASSHSYLAFLYYAGGQYQKAETAAKRALELNPKKTYDHFTLAEILLAQGHAQQSLAEIEQEPAAIWKLTGEALAYHALGRSQDSDAALAQLINQYPKNMAYQIAEIYAYRNQASRAFEWLERAYQQRDSGMRDVKIDPLLGSLRRDPRYIDLLRKMNLPG